MSAIKFEILNEYSYPIKIILEPESVSFLLPPGEKLEVQAEGNSPAFGMFHSENEQKQTQISFWPDQGTYELFYQGKRVWDLL